MCTLWINHCVPYELILTNYISSMIHGGHTTASHGSIEVTEGLSIAFRYHVWLPEIYIWLIVGIYPNHVHGPNHVFLASMWLMNHWKRLLSTMNTINIYKNPKKSGVSSPPPRLFISAPPAVKEWTQRSWLISGRRVATFLAEQAVRRRRGGYPLAI